MTYVLTLIANPNNPVLSDALVKQVATAIAAKDAPVWLNPDIACDISVNPAEPFDKNITAAIARDVIGANPIDVAIQVQAHRRKRLLVADMDSTIIEQECIDELGGAVGLKSQISEITARAMNGDIPFDDALRERVRLLKGLPERALEEVFKTRISLTPGAKQLIATMHDNGAYCALISGGFTFFTQRIAERVGFDFNNANTLEFKSGILTGEVIPPILGREAKRDALIKFRNERNLLTEDTLAVGDGANDLAMINEAGLGVAFHAKPKVAEIADVAINHGDLTALLYLQGYKAHEFADEKKAD